MRIIFLVQISREELSFYGKTIEGIIHIFSDLPLKTVEKSNIKETINAIQCKLRSSLQQNVFNMLTLHSFPSLWI